MQSTSARFFLSRRIAERLPPGCELGAEDLASLAPSAFWKHLIALIRPGHPVHDVCGVPHLGAMMDALRATDTFTRHRRQISKEVVDAEKCLTAELGRPPEAREVADRLGMDLDTYWRTKDRVKPVSHVRLDDSDGPDGESDGRSLAETLTDDTFRSAFSSILKEQAPPLCGRQSKVFRTASANVSCCTTAAT